MSRLRALVGVSVVVGTVGLVGAGSLAYAGSSSPGGSSLAGSPSASSPDPSAINAAAANLAQGRALLAAAKAASGSLRRQDVVDASSKVDAAETAILNEQDRLGGPQAEPAALADLATGIARVQGEVAKALLSIDLGAYRSGTTAAAPAASATPGGVGQGYSPPPGPAPSNGPAPPGTGGSSATIISTPPYTSPGQGAVGIPTQPPSPGNPGATICQTSPAACSSQPNNVLTFGAPVILAQDAIVGTEVVGGTRTYIVCVEVAYSDTPNGPTDNNHIIFGTGSNCSYGSQDVAWYGQAGIWPATIPTSCAATGAQCVVGIPNPNQWTGFWGGINTITFPYYRGGAETEQSGGWNSQAIHQFTYDSGLDNRWTYFPSDCQGQGDGTSYSGTHDPIVNCATFSLPFAFVPNADSGSTLAYTLGFVDSSIALLNQELTAIQVLINQYTAAFQDLYDAQGGTVGDTYCQSFCAPDADFDESTDSLPASLDPVSPVSTGTSADAAAYHGLRAIHNPSGWSVIHSAPHEWALGEAKNGWNMRIGNKVQSFAPYNDVYFAGRIGGGYYDESVISSFTHGCGWILTQDARRQLDAAGSACAAFGTSRSSLFALTVNCARHCGTGGTYNRLHMPTGATSIPECAVPWPAGPNNTLACPKGVLVHRITAADLSAGYGVLWRWITKDHLWAMVRDPHLDPNPSDPNKLPQWWFVPTRALTLDPTYRLPAPEPGGDCPSLPTPCNS